MTGDYVLAGELGDVAEGPRFDEDECSCLPVRHAPTEHDDGFGCTVPGCQCLAGWILNHASAYARGPGHE